MPAYPFIVAKQFQNSSLMSSGLFFASKYPIVSVTYEKFTDSVPGIPQKKERERERERERDLKINIDFLSFFCFRFKWCSSW
jgi:hypothetical protein